MLNVVIAGIAGRMGRNILNLSDDFDKINVVGGLEYKDNPLIGKSIKEALGVVDDEKYIITDDIDKILAYSSVDVVIDFTTAESSVLLADICGHRKIKMVIASTGLTDKQDESIRNSLKNIAFVKSTNMSVGVNLLFRLVELVSNTLDESYDIEVIESHHHNKKDAPSGTAKTIIDTIKKVLQYDESNVVYGRKGMVGARPEKEIGVHSIRAGSIVGEHTVMFTSDLESIELNHRAFSRIVFARGALLAAIFIADKHIGEYNMQDVLGI